MKIDQHLIAEYFKKDKGQCMCRILRMFFSQPHYTLANGNYSGRLLQSSLLFIEPTSMMDLR